MIPRWYLLLLACSALIGGCDDGRRLTVFAAASLTDVMQDAAGAFEAMHPDVDVVVSVAGSQQLAAQIRDGAPADVFLSADRRQIEAVEDQLDGDPRPVAANALAIAVAAGNPEAVERLTDLTATGLRVILPAPEVPAGAYARAALERAGVAVEPDDLTADVRSAVSKVALGEADAAIVYRSDIRAWTDEVEEVESELTADVRYYGGVLTASDEAGLSADFLDFLSSSTEGIAILERHGFSAP